MCNSICRVEDYLCCEMYASCPSCLVCSALYVATRTHNTSKVYYKNIRLIPIMQYEILGLLASWDFQNSWFLRSRPKFLFELGNTLSIWITIGNHWNLPGSFFRISIITSHWGRFASRGFFRGWSIIIRTVIFFKISTSLFCLKMFEFYLQILNALRFGYRQLAQKIWKWYLKNCRFKFNFKWWT